MELPSELRNMIYGYCLEDPAGINFVATFKHKRRTVERVSQEAQAELGGRNHYYHASRLNDSARAKYEEPVALTPALLAVSKQIHQEARDILYNNELIFADSFALYNFLINVGPDAAKQIKHLRIMGWGWGRAMKAYNHSCFAVLAWATNVETLHLDKTSGYSRSPKSAADQLYRDAFPWLEAIGVAKGKVDAGVDVLEFDDELFDHNYHYTASQLVTMGEDKVALFRETLRKLLGAQQKRLMASPVKKRKTAKIAADDEE
jgi:hypothetical protein